MEDEIERRQRFTRIDETDEKREISAMYELKVSGNKRKCLAGFVVIWAVLMAVAFYFCTLKQGFHEDEFYTYYSTARTNGFYVEDGKWMDRDTIRNEFVVLPGERFQYGLVKQVQSWLLYPSPSPRAGLLARMPSSA